MASPIDTSNPHNILLWSTDQIVDADHVCGSVVIQYGMLVELYDAGSGVNKWRPHNAAAGAMEMAVALNEPELNQPYNGSYVIGSLMRVRRLKTGDKFYGILVSGATVANSGFMQSNGDGKMKASTLTTAAGGVARLKCEDNPGAVGADTYVRTLVI